MELTREQAIDIAIELWEWLAETGADDKMLWPGWEKYGRMVSQCPLCELTIETNCGQCPYQQRFKQSCVHYNRYDSLNSRRTRYQHWEDAYRKQDCKQWAAKFLEQLRQLK